MVEDLIFDVGMHNGDDTENYLARGFRVVAVEANPSLVEAGKKRFSNAIAAGRLFVEGCAIFNREGTTKFWVNDEKDDWSALDREVGGRQGMSCHEITVPCARLSTVFKKYGVPFFLKSDIEKGDRYGLEDLNPNDLPRYVAVEAHEFSYLLLLWKYGYRRFKIVDQMRSNSTFPLFSNEHFHSRMLKRSLWYADRVKSKFGRNLKFKPGSSGPFGEESEGPWLPFEDVAYDFLHYSKGYGKRGTMNPLSWFDFHAKLG
jgi:FkbM family methyltransferase